MAQIIGEERAVPVQDHAGDAHVQRMAQAVLLQRPGLAVVGGLVDAFLKDAGVERAGVLGAPGIEHDRGHRPQRQTLGLGFPRRAEVAREADAAGAVVAVALGDDVVVGDVVHVGECAPHLARDFRVERHLVAGVPPRGPGVLVPPDPGLAGVEGAGEADVRVGDVMAVGFERVDVVVPGRGDDQAVADPGAAGSRFLAGGRVGVAVEPGAAAVMGDVRFAPDQDHAVGIAVADGDAEGSVAAFEGLAGRGGDVVGRDVVLLETRILEEGGPPGVAAVVAAIDASRGAADGSRCWCS